MPAIWLQVVVIGSNRQRNFAEMPLGIEVMHGVRQFREREGVIDERAGSCDDAHGMEAQKQLLGTGLEETHSGVASGPSDTLLVQIPARLSFQFRDAVRKGGSRSRKSALREERARRALLF